MTTSAQQPESFEPEVGSAPYNPVDQILSNFAFETSVREAQSKVNNSSDGSSSSVKESAANAIAEAADNVKSTEANKLQGNDGKIANESFTKKLFDSALTNGITKPVTEQDRTDAKEALAKDISDLVPEADREAMKGLQDAIIDGDLAKVQEALKGLSADPEKLATMVKEINGRFDKLEKGGGLDLAMDSSGNMLIYKENGNTAVSINPATGETTLRAVERQSDGSVLLKPGEIVNRDAAGELHKIADAGTGSLTHVHKPQESLRKLEPILPSVKPPILNKPGIEKPPFPGKYGDDIKVKPYKDMSKAND